ncbi:prolipoprotein diacylglyceryl transferase [Ruminococcus sp.]|uniref:prolipoprotein diacylglyceryl transferase n=1 Tax=Ruminococcus sp. TaxID=41978 RepID=UPI0026095EF1|nr:prolipoprotein diacylglyceryl transferase [Ruminococcus sp.]MDD6988034.1 prolipoprotein diacylglyceryl transferase [Ruminococcus sp.]MDY6202730.1 prolipoprotein diacylglyceryl transferase [Ruminococcus sp.]
MEYNVSFPGLGLDFTISPVAFSVGSYPIYWYGIIIASGLLLAVLYAWRSAPRFNVDFNKLVNCILVGIITGIIGARLYFCFFQWDYYSRNPIEILYINNGGLAIYGGIIGALAGGLTVAKIQKMKILPILDIAMMGFLLGQGIGRWGNFTNQEAFGTPTNLPWRMVSEGTNMVGVHPCFLYESLWCLLGFVLLHFYGKYKQKYSGQIFFSYLVWYGFERMFVEGLRTDSLYLPFQLFGMDIRVSQVLSFAIFVTGLVMLIINRNKEDSFYADYRRKKGIGTGERKSKKSNA